MKGFPHEITRPFQVLAVLLCLNSNGNCQDNVIDKSQPHQLEVQDTLPKRPSFLSRDSRLHFAAGYEIWSAERFQPVEMIEEPSLLGDLGIPESPHFEYAACYEVAVTFPDLKPGGFPLTIGAGIQRLRFKYSGYIHVDEIISGWLSEDYLGESLVLTTYLQSYSLKGSLNLKPYQPQHVFGYSAHVFTSIRYFDIDEIEDIYMQGDYRINGTTGAFEYQTEEFQRVMPADKIALEVGGRLELHASRFISLILPQITLRGTVYRKKVPKTVFKSELDGDVLELPERKSSYYGVFVMAGISIHL